MSYAKKYGNNFEIIRDRQEDILIERIDKQVESHYNKGERVINVSMFEALKIKQPAIAWQLGLLAGWEMEQ